MCAGCLTVLHGVHADGAIASNSERTNTIRTPVLGGWHMLTISTMQDGSPVRRPLAYDCHFHVGKHLSGSWHCASITLCYTHQQKVLEGKGNS